MSRKHTLKFELGADYSGASYTLFEDGLFIRQWSIRYGYNEPERQEQERNDRKIMCDDLETRGLLHLYKGSYK